MTRPSDHYQTLGIPRRATQEEIRKAFRELVHIWHPDVSKEPNATTRFQKINEAYQVLSDTRTRREYDLGQGWRPIQDPADQAREESARAAQNERRNRVAESARQQMARGARQRIAEEEAQLRSPVCPECKGSKRPGFATCFNCRPNEERCPLCQGFKRKQYRTCYNCNSGGRD